MVIWEGGNGTIVNIAVSTTELSEPFFARNQIRDIREVIKIAYGEKRNCSSIDIELYFQLLLSWLPTDLVHLCKLKATSIIPIRQILINLKYSPTHRVLSPSSKSVLAVREKKSTEEPSTGVRCRHLRLSLITSSRKPPMRISHVWRQHFCK